MWSTWEPYKPASDEEVASMPHEIKVQMGSIFGQLTPRSLQQQGPIEVFERINRLCREGLCTMEISRRRRGSSTDLRARYRAGDMGEFITLH